MSPSPGARIEPPLRGVSNPFASSTVGSPWDEATADVPDINRRAFEACLRLIAQVASTGSSTSLMLYGEPGSGKTHLLSRLRRAVEQASEPAPVFIGVRMQTAASMIWRYLRRHMSLDLMRRPPAGPSRLDLLLDRRRSELSHVPIRDLSIALENLLHGVNVRDSAAWLRGEELPEEALRSLGISTSPIDEDAQEDRAKDVIKALCELARPATVIFALDQVEALQSHPGDQTGMFALGKLVTALHDELKNALVISCVQTSFIQPLEKVIRGAHADRMMRQNAEALHPLTWEQAAALVTARLNSQPKLARLREDRNDLWPIDEEKLREEFAGGGTCIARRVIFRCKTLFDEAIGAEIAPPALDLEGFLGGEYERRQAGRRDLPAMDGDFVVRDGLPLLLHAALQGMRIRNEDLPPGVDLELAQPDGRRVGFSYCNQAHPNSLAARLRKILTSWDPAGIPELVLVRDARLGIKSTARRTRERLKELESRGARIVRPSAEALAALDAIRSLLADAESGDLSHQGRRVPPGSVEEWLRSNMPEPLRELVDEIHAKPIGEDATLPEALTACLRERKVLSAQEAARETDYSLEEVIRCARQNPMQFGLLEGPPPVLYEMVQQRMED